MHEASNVRVRGPLARYAPAFVEYLAGLGYADTSAARHVRRLALVSASLEKEGLSPSAVDETVVATVVDECHRRGRSPEARPASFDLLLGFLRQRGIVPAAAPVAPSPFDQLLGAYRRYLEVERSLAPLSLPGYLGSATWFLAERCGQDPERIGALSAADVGAFVLRVAERRGPSSVNTVVVGVRSLLRWLFASGVIDTPLAQATPWLARGHLGTLPRTLPEGQALALLGTCDRGTFAGARDLAVLTVLVRLGLRAGEVAALVLDDIDWRKGELDISGKGGFRDPLPLPVDVGDALVAYLRLRGRRELRNVFVHVRAPHGPMTMTSVRAPPPRHGGRPVAPRGAVARDRPGAAPSRPGHDRPLRQGRLPLPGLPRPPVAGGQLVSALCAALADYLALRRALGYQLTEAGRALSGFVAHLDAGGTETVTVAAAVTWATEVSTAGVGRRLQAIRGFARYLQALDPTHEVPPTRLVPVGTHRAVPHLYSDTDVNALMTAARSLRPALRAATTEVVIGVLATTGMRIGEVLALDVGDVSWSSGVINVDASKFSRGRHVPVAPSTLAALDDYRHSRPRPASGSALFVHSRRGRLGYGSFAEAFAGALDASAISSGPHRPRIHDLRHSFAVATVLGWYREGADVAALLPRLSTYLGHTSPAATYWYLSAAPELMAIVAERLEPGDGGGR